MPGQDARPKVGCFLGNKGKTTVTDTVQNAPEWPPLGFTDAEAEMVVSSYQEARIILEYGSGWSTVQAAKMPGKLIIAVESDPGWARQLTAVLDAANHPSPAILHSVDIGQIGKWGRPVDNTAWRKFATYPLGVWSAPYFRHPDVVLIDGRFRPACMGAVLLGMQKPVRVLFDDYVQRPLYHMVEKFAQPSQLSGRMAVFDLTPREFSPVEHRAVVHLFSQASLADEKDQYAV